MIKKIGFFLLIFATLIFQSEGVVSAQETEITPGALEPITPSAGGNILWDTSHGVYLDFSPSGWYSELAAAVTAQGFTVDENNSGVLNLNLSNYEIIVVNVTSAWNSAYSSAEVTAIQNFVNGGGGLLIMGDNADPIVPNSNVNPVAQIFGTTVGLSTISPSTINITNLTAHPIFASVSQFSMHRAGQISGNTPSSEEAWADTGEAVVTVAEPESGRVVVLDDANTWAEPYFTNVDNQLFSENVFAWLGDAEASISCILEQDLARTGGNLEFDYLLATANPATWTVWLVLLNPPFAVPILSAPLPIINPPISPSFSIPLAGFGTVGALTVVTTSTDGVICSDWDIVNTGAPSAGGGSLQELRELSARPNGLLPQ